MRLSKLWRKIIKESHKNTAPIQALSKAIIDGSLSMANSLRPSMEFNSQEENDRNWGYVLFEFQYLLLHLVSRSSVVQLGAEKRDALLEEIGPLVIEPTIGALFGNWSDDSKNTIKSEYCENLAKSELEYGACKQVWSDKGVDDMNDIVMHRFGKNVACVMGGSHNLGLILEVQRTLVKGLKETQFNQSLETAFSVL